MVAPQGIARRAARLRAKQEQLTAAACSSKTPSTTCVPCFPFNLEKSVVLVCFPFSSLWFSLWFPVSSFLLGLPFGLPFGTTHPRRSRRAIASPERLPPRCGAAASGRAWGPSRPAPGLRRELLRFFFAFVFFLFFSPVCTSETQKGRFFFFFLRRSKNSISYIYIYMYIYIYIYIYTNTVYVIGCCFPGYPTCFVKGQTQLDTFKAAWEFYGPSHATLRGCVCPVLLFETCERPCGC